MQLASLRQELTRHMGSQSVTCHLAEVASRFYPSKGGTWFSDPDAMRRDAVDPAGWLQLEAENEEHSIPIRNSNRFCESIRLVKNWPFLSLAVMQFFLLIYCVILAKKYTTMHVTHSYTV